MSYLLLQGVLGVTAKGYGVHPVPRWSCLAVCLQQSYRVCPCSPLGSDKQTEWSNGCQGKGNLMRRKRRLQEEEGRREDREGCELLTRIGGRQRKWQGEGWMLRMLGTEQQEREERVPHTP